MLKHLLNSKPFAIRILRIPESEFRILRFGARGFGMPNFGRDQGGPLHMKKGPAKPGEIGKIRDPKIRGRGTLQRCKKESISKMLENLVPRLKRLIGTNRKNGSEKKLAKRED